MERQCTATETQEAEKKAVDHVSYDNWSAEVCDSMARLVANGEMEWPTGLTPQQEDELLLLVRSLRRDELMTYITSRIAITLNNRNETPESDRMP